MNTATKLVAIACVALLVGACRDSAPTGSVGPPLAAACTATAGTPNLAGFTATAVASTYAAAGNGTGFVTTGQSADVMLSGIGFDKAGGSLLFNHPRSIASDGTRLALSDGNNNRVLIWNSAPTGNTPPDIVIGQTDFDHNAPGSGLAQMRWPGQIVFTSDGKLLVADSYNDRVLVWLSVPTSNGKAADFAITATSMRWPWGVWSDGSRLVVSSTGTSSVIVWSSFPASGTAAPSFVITGSGIGTPRTITSNGTAIG